MAEFLAFSSKKLKTTTTIILRGRNLDDHSQVWYILNPVIMK